MHLYAQKKQLISKGEQKFPKLEKESKRGHLLSHDNCFCFRLCLCICCWGHRVGRRNVQDIQDSRSQHVAVRKQKNKAEVIAHKATVI